MNADEMQIVALKEYDVVQTAALAAGNRQMITAASEQLRQRLAEIESVRAAERAANLMRFQEYQKLVKKRTQEIIANVPECDAVYDVAGMLSILNEIKETGFGAPEEDYLREILALVRR